MRYKLLIIYTATMAWFVYNVAAKLIDGYNVQLSASFYIIVFGAVFSFIIKESISSKIKKRKIELVVFSIPWGIGIILNVIGAIYTDDYYVFDSIVSTHYCDAMSALCIVLGLIIHEKIRNI
mgnify:CR=1 FL=1